jgi:hypothetical protein
MTSRTLWFCLTLCCATVALAGEQQPAAAAAPATTQPAKPLDAYRYLDHGSWIVTEAHVRTNATPATIKRKAVVTTLPGTNDRAVEELRWNMDAFEPTGPAQPLAKPDRRGFDELGFTPLSTLPDQPLTVARKRYLCSVSTYVFKDDAGGRTTTVTLWRDKSGQTQLPPRAMSVNNKDLPLPGDALQADFKIEAPGVSTSGQRRIVSIAAPVRVGSQTLSCLVESTQTQGTSHEKPMSLNLREWFSHELPGERLRTVTAMSVGPMRVESDVTVLDFHVAKLSADASASR